MLCTVSQDSGQVGHKSAPPQFTARDGKTDRSMHVRGGKPDHPTHPDSSSQIPCLLAESPHGQIAQPCMDDHVPQNPAMTTWAVPGTTKDELERKDPKDPDQGTSNEVV